MKLKEDLDDPTIVHQIHEILIPKEYTKLDEIADGLRGGVAFDKVNR